MQNKQVTLTGGVQTRLVNQKNTSNFDVDIGRANNGESNILNTRPKEPGWLGNPYLLSDGYSRAESIRCYREDFYERLEDDEFRAAVEALRGQTLACWCVDAPKTAAKEPYDTCHGEIILAHLQEDLDP